MAKVSGQSDQHSLQGLDLAILAKGSNIFRRENLVLFTVTSIHNIWKSTKNKNSEARWKVTDNSRLK